MKDIKQFLIDFFKASEAVKIRSQIIPIVGVTKFPFDASRIEPYSFEIVNTGIQDMLMEGVVVVKGANANSMDTSLTFPRVGNFKRNDIIVLTGGTAISPLVGFIRVDLELTG